MEMNDSLLQPLEGTAERKGREKVILAPSTLLCCISSLRSGLLCMHNCLYIPLQHFSSLEVRTFDSDVAVITVLGVCTFFFTCL